MIAGIDTAANATLNGVRAAGIAVDIPSPGRPTTRIVIVDDSTGTATIAGYEVFPSRGVDVATQLHDAAEAVRSRLKSLRVDRVVVRRADRPPRPSNAEGPRLRLLTEGAAASAARSVVVDTHIGTGKDTGAWFGSSKAGVDRAAGVLLQASGLDLSFTEATSAALAGLSM